MSFSRCMYTAVCRRDSLARLKYRKYRRMVFAPRPIIMAISWDLVKPACPALGFPGLEVGLLDLAVCSSSMSFHPS